MSLTVVCATMLAAMACKQLRREVKEEMKRQILGKPLSFASKILKASSIERKPKISVCENKNTTAVTNSFRFQSLLAIVDDAIRTSIMCTVSQVHRSRKPQL